MGSMNLLQLRMSSLLSLSSLERLYLTPCRVSLMDCRTVPRGGRGLQKKEALRRGFYFKFETDCAEMAPSF